MSYIVCCNFEMFLFAIYLQNSKQLILKKSYESERSMKYVLAFIIEPGKRKTKEAFDELTVIWLRYVMMSVMTMHHHLDCASP